MALLPKKTRIKYFKDLGLGEYSPSTILKFQKMAFANSKEHDKKYGVNTDRALRHWHNVWRCCNPKHFKPQEFKCPCGRCTGYPTQMRVKELKHVQTIRDHYGQPMTITSGLRCKQWNRECGGVENSAHTKGLAVDFKMPTVTDTFARRKTAINYMKGLKNHKYSYCDGYNSYGKVVHSKTMGSAIHTEVKP